MSVAQLVAFDALVGIIGDVRGFDPAQVVCMRDSSAGSALKLRSKRYTQNRYRYFDMLKFYRYIGGPPANRPVYRQEK